MALAGNGIDHLTLDDLLEAVNPAPPSIEERLRHALTATIKCWQEGQVTDEQAEMLIKALVAANVNRQVNQMVNEFFTPQRRRTGYPRLSLL